MRGTVGGGEILKQASKKTNTGASSLDDSLIKLFDMLPVAKVIIYILLTVICIYLILKLFNIKSPFKGKGIKSEFNNIQDMKSRDTAILRANKFMNWANRLIEGSILAMDKSSKEYWQYNIKRAGIKIPGGSRDMKETEFHSLIQIFALFSVGLSVIILLFINSILGWVLIISTLIIANTCPLMIIRQMVKEKDMEIRENFADFYLMIHYVIIANASTPLSGIIKSYDKTTSSEEMHRFVDSCIHYIDTYGEYEATRYISKEYRELPEVGKLMRLIRQAYEGGDVQSELMGFRSELLKAKQYAITKRMEKLVAKAKASFNVLMPVLIQAILSAMSIYMSDLGLAKGLLG